MKFIKNLILLILLSAVIIKSEKQLFEILEKDIKQNKVQSNNLNQSEDSIFLQTSEKSKKEEAKSLFASEEKNNGKLENKETAKITKAQEQVKETNSNKNKTENKEGAKIKTENSKASIKEENKEKATEKTDATLESKNEAIKAIIYAETNEKEKEHSNEISGVHEGNKRKSKKKNSRKHKARNSNKSKVSKKSKKAMKKNDNNKTSKNTRKKRTGGRGSIVKYANDNNVDLNNLKFLEVKLQNLKEKMNKISDDSKNMMESIKILGESQDKNNHIHGEMINFVEKNIKKDDVNKIMKSKEEALNNILDKNSFSLNYIGNKIIEIEKKISLGQKIGINSSTKLILNNKEISGQDIIDNLKFVSLVKQNCGDDFSKCKILSKEDYEVERKEEAEILKNVKKLRQKRSETF